MNVDVRDLLDCEKFLQALFEKRSFGQIGFANHSGFCEAAKGQDAGTELIGNLVRRKTSFRSVGCERNLRDLI